MTAIYQGTTNTPADLHAFFYFDGSLFDPYLVQYTIFDPDDLVIVGQHEKPALRDSIGWFYADWIPSQTQRLGPHKIIWEFKRADTDMLQSDVVEFNIIKDLSEGSESIHIPSGNGMGVSRGGNGAGNFSDIGSGFVIRDFYGRVRVFNV